MINLIRLKPLIVLSGPDASGKTTLAYNLASIFSRKYTNVKIVRIRGTHTIAFILTQIFKNILRYHGNDLHYFSIYIPKKLVKLWIWIELFSITPLLFFYYYILRLKYVIISDRSIPDFIIWVTTGFSQIKASEIIRSYPIRIALIWAIKIRPVFITASKDVLIFRKKNEKQLIESMYTYFDVLAKAIGLPVINTSYMSLEDSVKVLMKTLCENSLNGRELCEII